SSSADQRVERHCDEEEGQVGDRVREEPAGARWGRTAKERQRERDEGCPEPDRRSEVQRPELVEYRGKERDADEKKRVADDRPRRLVVALDDREHRDARRLVVTPDEDRQRPEVRRRPDEDDEKEQEGRQRQ